MALAEAVPGAGLVSGCQVWNLDPLGSAVRAGGGRWILAKHVHRRACAVSGSPEALRPPLPVWLQGYHQRLEAGKVGPRETDGALQARRCAVLLRACQR